MRLTNYYSTIIWNKRVDMLNYIAIWHTGSPLILLLDKRFPPGVRRKRKPSHFNITMLTTYQSMDCLYEFTSACLLKFGSMKNKNYRNFVRNTRHATSQVFLLMFSLSLLSRKSHVSYSDLGLEIRCFGPKKGEGV